MPVAFCSLETAYGDWGTKKTGVSKVQTGDELTKQPHQTLQQTSNKPPESAETAAICPNCKTCNAANNKFQQQVVDQIIQPRPSWVSVDQYAQQLVNPYAQFDPYNRYWANREDFGGTMGPTMGPMTQPSNELLYNVIMIMLAALFFIQLVELIYK
jgi:hypothetical protein